MIDPAIWNDPDYSDLIAEFRASARKRWKAGVKKYFNKRSGYKINDTDYLSPKENHRFLVAPFGDSRTPRLSNALSINWTPDSGHIAMNVVPIMVKSGKQGNTMNIGTRYGKVGRVTSSNSPMTARDLVRLLSEGTKSSPKRYVVSVDARVKGGYRRGTTNTAWVNFFYYFMSEAGGINDMIERLADKLENRIAYRLVEEF